MAGQSTSVFYNNAKICFDIAQGLPFQINAKLYCLTHLHSDHGSGINYLLAQRSLYRLPEAPILVPAQNIKSLEIILKEWMKIEDFEYQYRLLPVEKGTTFDLGEKYQVRAFPTTHRVTSFGYIIYEKKKKLKKEYQNLERQALLNAKSRGESIEKDHFHPIVAFTGDTQIEFLDAHPDVLEADVLFLESNYLDSKKSIAETRKWGHTHLDEIATNIERFKNKQLCFIHLSARYSTKEAQVILRKKLDGLPEDKYSIFPRP
ncbi:MAG: MBL fold metallo-hydrolase [Pseudomonadota bacterium]